MQRGMAVNAALRDLVACVKAAGIATFNPTLTSQYYPEFSTRRRFGSPPGGSDQDARPPRPTGIMPRGHHPVNPDYGPDAQSPYNDSDLRYHRYAQITEPLAPDSHAAENNHYLNEFNPDRFFYHGTFYPWGDVGQYTSRRDTHRGRL